MSALQEEMGAKMNVSLEDLKKRRFCFKCVLFLH